MSRYISDILREFVAKRASFRCEYCRVHAQNSFFAFHIDHIISLKHGGTTSAENLAYTCQICNLSKGSDIATFLEQNLTPVRFFNPRIDIWEEHFELEETGLLDSKTDIGSATIKILDLNHPESIIERREMLQFGVF
jgi:HNH endonuclease